MARKKIKIKVSFNGEQFAPRKATLEKGPELDTFFKEPAPIVKNWSDDEVFIGKNSEYSHLSWVQLSLISNGKFEFSNKLSSGSRFVVSFDKFSGFDTLGFSFNGKSVIVNGSLLLTLSIPSELMDDIVQSGLLYFDQLGFRPKGNSDIFEFSKYGHNWEAEDNEADSFRNGVSTSFFTNRPKVEFP